MAYGRWLMAKVGKKSLAGGSLLLSAISYMRNKYADAEACLY